MLRYQSIFLFLLLVLPISVYTAEYGGEHPVSIITQERNSGMDIYFNNKSVGSCTITFYFTRLINAKTDKPLPYTTIIPKKTMLKGLTVRQDDVQKKWDTYFMYDYQFGAYNAVHDPTVTYRLPYKNNSSYPVIQGYNGKFTHHGEHRYSIDWGMPVGTLVLAARAGVVIDIKDIYQGHGLTHYYWNRNNYVKIEHSDGTIGYYVHFKHKGVKVAVGQKVMTGDVIALSGNVGYSDVPHVHFSVIKPANGKKIESIPVKFKTMENASGILIEGKSYRAQ